MSVGIDVGTTAFGLFAPLGEDLGPPRAAVPLGGRALGLRTCPGRFASLSGRGTHFGVKL